MDPPVAAEVETPPAKTEETKGSYQGYHCGLCDIEVVHKIAQELLPGLASACVDNTTGGIFTSAGSVAVDMRKEMVEYLTQRSETFVAEFILSENAHDEEISEHPSDIITYLIDDFTGSKRNMFSRVSEWILSDRREDRIDDFVQEMEINGFWLLARRESVATMLLKNVDYKNAFHCNIICSSEEDLVDHKSKCKFRTMNCTSEGCTIMYCAAQKENHEAICPFMILQCEQKCPDFIMRREMDRHCITICPMKLVNCAFSTVGCQSSIPRCSVEQHNVENLASHLLYILRAAHKEATDEDLKPRVEQIQSLSNTEKLARARDARSLTYLIKDVQAKLGPLEVKPKSEISDSKEIYTIEEEESTESPSKVEGSQKGSPTKTESSPTGKPTKDSSDSPKKDEEHPKSPLESPMKMESSSTRKSAMESPSVEKSPLESPTKEDPPESPKPMASSLTKEESIESTIQVEESKDKVESSSPLEEEKQKEPPMKEVFSELSKQIDDSKESEAKKEEEQKQSPKIETLEESSHIEEEESTKSPKRETVKEESSNVTEELTTKSPKEETFKEASSSDEEDSTSSPKKGKVKESSSSDEK